MQTLHRAQLTRDPDESVISHAAAAAGTASSTEGEHKISEKPVHTSGQTQTADPTSISTVELIKRLQQRSTEVLSYLHNNQEAAAD